MATVAPEKKSIVIRVSPDEHQALKEYAVLNKTTLQDYILGLIEADKKNRQKEGKE